MAKNRNDGNPAVRVEEPAVIDEPVVSERIRPREPVRPGRGIGLFQMYKPHQGRKIRLYTAIGAGIVIVGGAVWLHTKLEVAAGQQNLWLATSITAAVGGLMALLTWYLVGVRPGSVDFLIATESEMKKVTWSSRSEVIGATKVVVGMVLLLSAGLFVVDILFTFLFRWLGVLRTPF